MATKKEAQKERERRIVVAASNTPCHTTILPSIITASFKLERKNKRRKEEAVLNQLHAMQCKSSSILTLSSSSSNIIHN